MSSSGSPPTSDTDLRARLESLERHVSFRDLGHGDDPFAWVCLTVGQVVSVLGCAASALFPFWYIAVPMQPPRTSLDYWVMPGVILGAFIGFLYSAAMFVVFSRVKRRG
jgi:hypothetical protein